MKSSFEGLPKNESDFDSTGKENFPDQDREILEKVKPIKFPHGEGALRLFKKKYLNEKKLAERAEDILKRFFNKSSQILKFIDQKDKERRFRIFQLILPD